MVEDNRRYACLKLDTPGDVKEIIREVLEDIREEDAAVEMAGRICNLLQVWLKAHGTSKVDELEKRIENIEKERNLDKIKVRI